VDVNVDRILANESGLTQRDVASSLLISLSASGQVAPNQWLDPQNGVNYQVSAQTPQYKIDTFDAMRRTPITPLSGGATQLLYNLAQLKRNNSPEIESHYDIQPVIDIFASPDKRDLGGLAADIEGLLPKCARRSRAEHQSICAGRWTPCGPPSLGWAWE
jgi:multidrug efflux pump subunit AcrB